MRQSPSSNLRNRLLPVLMRRVKRAPPALIRGSRPLVRAALARAPGWSRRVREGMDCLLGPAQDRGARVDAYFDHLSRMIVDSALVLRLGLTASGLTERWRYTPEAEQAFYRVVSAGRGCLLASPHLIGSELLAGLICSRYPVTVLVRKSPDARYEAVKQEWYDGLGLNVVHRPPRGAGMAEMMEVTLALRALRKNQVLALTPDLIARPGKGIPVRWFDRDLHLPAGAFFLAARTGAPLIPSFFIETGGTYQILSQEVLPLPECDSLEGTVAAAAQAWADEFAAFLRQHPDMWQFWLDRRWRRWMGLADE